MTSLVPHILLVFLLGPIAAGLGCDSNPTPHPGHADPYTVDAHGADSAYGEVTGNVPGRGGNEQDPDDMSPGANTDGNTAENCPPDASDASDDAGDGGGGEGDADDNETPAGQSGGGSDSAFDADVDPSERDEEDDADDNSTPSAAPPEYGQVEDSN